MAFDYNDVQSTLTLMSADGKAVDREQTHRGVNAPTIK
jgi:hypothetical protein